MIASIVLLATLLCVVGAMPSIEVTANVRGKRYEVKGESVEDICNAVEDITGLDAEQQSILFRGKLLERKSMLQDLGVAPGDTLNVVKGRRQRQRPSAEEVAAPMGAMGDGDSTVGSGGGMGGANGLGGMMGGMGGMGGMGDMMGGMNGMNEDELRQAMENINPEDMQKAMQAMDEILDSDFVDEYFADEERLESARQQMLSNLDQYDQMMPGFKEQAAEIASSPEKWREAMNQAREQITNLKQQRDVMRSSGLGGAPKPKMPDTGVDDFDDDE